MPEEYYFLEITYTDFVSRLAKVVNKIKTFRFTSLRAARAAYNQFKDMDSRVKKATIYGPYREYSLEDENGV